MIFSILIFIIIRFFLLPTPFLSFCFIIFFLRVFFSLSLFSLSLCLFIYLSVSLHISICLSGYSSIFHPPSSLSSCLSLSLYCIYLYSYLSIYLLIQLYLVLPYLFSVLFSPGLISDRNILFYLNISAVLDMCSVCFRACEENLV